MWNSFLKLFGLGPVDFIKATRAFADTSVIRCSSKNELSKLVAADGGTLDAINEWDILTRRGGLDTKGQSLAFRLIRTQNFIWLKFLSYPTYHLGLKLEYISFTTHFAPKTSFFAYADPKGSVQFSFLTVGNTWLLNHLSSSRKSA